MYALSSIAGYWQTFSLGALSPAGWSRGWLLLAGSVRLLPACQQLHSREDCTANTAKHFTDRHCTDTARRSTTALNPTAVQDAALYSTALQDMTKHCSAVQCSVRHGRRQDMEI